MLRVSVYLEAQFFLSKLDLLVWCLEMWLQYFHRVFFPVPPAAKQPCIVMWPPPYTLWWYQVCRISHPLKKMSLRSNSSILLSAGYITDLQILGFYSCVHLQTVSQRCGGWFFGWSLSMMSHTDRQCVLEVCLEVSPQMVSFQLTYSTLPNILIWPLRNCFKTL